MRSLLAVSISNIWDQGLADDLVTLFRSATVAFYDKVMDFTDGFDHVQIGAGMDALSNQERTGHAYLSEVTDLFARVKGAAGDLDVRDNFLV